uniref:BTB domain-containing protein n=1 Tax=Panagrellus redivivus TaxID=6233 RepID=A0A7E4W711_PANRE
MSRLFTDSVSLHPNEDERVDSSGLRKIPGCPHLQWQFDVVQRSDGQHLGAYIKVVGGPATVTGTIVAFDGYVAKYQKYYKPEPKPFKFNFEKGERHGFGKIIEVGNHFWFEITCNITIMPGGDTTIPPTMVHEFMQYNGCDAVIKIDRDFLSMISPEFRAMLDTDGEETETSVIEIEDFAFDVVKRVIHHCCGRTVAYNTPATVMEMLRFCEKYNIKPPIEKLQAWLNANLKVDDFVQTADYAWKHSIKPLQDKCGKMFYNNIEKLSRSPDFLEFDPNLVAAVFKAGAAAGKSFGLRF